MSHSEKTSEFPGRPQRHHQRYENLRLAVENERVDVRLILFLHLHVTVIC